MDQSTLRGTIWRIIRTERLLWEPCYCICQWKRSDLEWWNLVLPQFNFTRSNESILSRFEFQTEIHQILRNEINNVYGTNLKRNIMTKRINWWEVLNMQSFSPQCATSAVLTRVFETGNIEEKDEEDACVGVLRNQHSITWEHSSRWTRLQTEPQCIMKTSLISYHQGNMNVKVLFCGVFLRLHSCCWAWVAPKSSGWTPGQFFNTL